MMSDLMKNITGGRKKKGTKKRGGAGEIPGLKPVQTGGELPEELPEVVTETTLGDYINKYNKAQADYNANKDQTTMSELTKAYNNLITIKSKYTGNNNTVLTDSYDNCVKNYNELSNQSGGEELKPTTNSVGGKKKRRRSKKSKKGGKKSKRSGKSRRHRK